MIIKDMNKCIEFEEIDEDDLMRVSIGGYDIDNELSVSLTKEEIKELIIFLNTELNK